MGCLQEGLRTKGWAVNHQPGTRVDGYSHLDHQKRDLQVSRKRVVGSQRRLETDKEGAKKRDQSREECCGDACIYTWIVHMLTHINNNCVKVINKPCVERNKIHSFNFLDTSSWQQKLSSASSRDDYKVQQACMIIIRLPSFLDDF